MIPNPVLDTLKLTTRSVRPIEEPILQLDLGSYPVLIFKLQDLFLYMVAGGNGINSVDLSGKETPADRHERRAESTRRGMTGSTSKLQGSSEGGEIVITRNKSHPHFTVTVQTDQLDKNQSSQVQAWVTDALLKAFPTG